MSRTGTGRATGRIRITRAVFAFGVVVEGFLFILDLAAGSPHALIPAVIALVFLLLVFTQTRVIGMQRQVQELDPASGGERMTARERALRHVTGRPRRIMTPEDYRRLRELEGELGWELSELPASVTITETARPRREPPQAPDHVRAAKPAEAPRPYPGIPQEAVTAARTAIHFAELAKVGREHCLSYCPICLYRLFGPMPGGVKPDKSMWQWVEKNWGWKQ